MNSRFKTPWRSLAPAVILCAAWMPTPATADLIGIKLSGNTTVTNDFSEAVYSSWNGMEVNLPGAGGTITPNSMPAGLSQGTLTISNQGAVSNMKASLETGSVGASASSGSTVEADASLYDTLTFHGNGSASFGLSLDGQPALRTDTGSFSYQLIFQAGGAGLRYNGGQNCNICGAPGSNVPQFGGTSSGFVNGTFTNESINGFNFTGQLNYTDGEVVPIGLVLQTTGSQGGLADFLNTAKISLDSAPGSYTSASGVFLTGDASPVPEPSYLPLLGLAFAGLLVRRLVRA